MAVDVVVEVVGASEGKPVDHVVGVAVDAGGRKEVGAKVTDGI